MSVIQSTGALTTSTNKINKVRCFPIELHCVNMKPLTKYNFYFNGTLMNAFCKPFGKNLGADIIADANGRLTILFLMNISYNDRYVVTQTDDLSYYTKNNVFEFIDPSGISSKSYLPTIMKPTR